MPPAAAFDEVLDRTLQGGAAVAPPTGRAAARVATAAAFGFFQFDGGDNAAAAVTTTRRPSVSFRAGPGRAAYPEREVAPPPSRPRSNRRSCLTLEQHVALRDLQALGAPIRADFTKDELRSAFRVLARRYHPDRHPGVTDSITAELSTLFWRLRAAYSILSRA